MIRTGGRAEANDSWHTDQWILDLIGEHYDPCPFNEGFSHAHDTDGLKTDWMAESERVGGRVFVNPPYSKPMLWVRKAIKARNKGCKVFMLMKHDSSTRWYRELHEAGAHFLLCHGRLQYGTGKGASFPSVLVVLQ